MKQTLFKRSKVGKIQTWAIEVESNKYRTHEGFVDGQITTSEWTECKGKNLNRANATTPEEQALKEAEAKVTKKKDQGYSENESMVDSSAKKISPMLAHKYEDYKDNLKGIIIHSQPKLDGIRCICPDYGMFTRNGKPITSAPHIWGEVKEVLAALPKGSKLDGELYNHELKHDFNEITSIVRKSKLTEEDLKKSENLIQYHIYDLDITILTFQERQALLKKVIKPTFKYLKLVETVIVGDLSLTRRRDDLDTVYASYLNQGFEGQVLRNAFSKYDNSRSKNLLKRKEFLDEEFEIIDIEEGVGNRSGMMGRIKFKMKNGKTFDSNARGTHEYFKELLINKKKYIGKMATVRYQNLTPEEQLPRFPVMVGIRDFE